MENRENLTSFVGAALAAISTYVAAKTAPTEVSKAAGTGRIRTPQCFITRRSHAKITQGENEKGLKRVKYFQRPSPETELYCHQEDFQSIVVELQNKLKLEISTSTADFT